MQIIGRLCDRVDTVEGIKSFIESYDVDPYKYIFEREIFNVSRIFEKEYKYLAFLEYDGDARQVFYLEPEEHIMVYNDIEGEIFNTDSMAFFSLIRDGHRIATFCTEHSPWSFPVSDNESVNEMDLTTEEVLEKINTYCSTYNLETPANLNNTLIIRAL